MDQFGGITPNPNEAPRLDTTPQQPQAYFDPGMVAQQPPQTFASVPMTDPNAPQPMSMGQPAMPPMNQIDSMLDPQPSQPAVSTGGSSTGKLVIMIVVGLILVIGVGVGGYFAGYASGKQAGKTESDAAYQAEQAKQQADDTSNSDNKTPDKLDLSDAKDPDAAAYSKDETKEAALGEAVRSSDGFVLRVNNIERNFTVDDPDYKADPTKELIKVNFQMGNATKTKTMDINNVPFHLIDSTGADIVPETIASYDGKFDTTKLDPGTESNASLIFAVTKDDAPLKFSRTQPYRISNQNRQVTFTVIVTIAEKQ